MATGVQIKPKTITNSVARESTTAASVTDAVQLTQENLDALRATLDADGAAAMPTAEGRWPRVYGLSVAVLVSAGLWWGAIALATR